MTWLGKVWKGIGNTFSSLGARITGSRLTGAEREANAFSAQQAQLARDYDTQMSNTSYQRGVADMQAAGVNPALMYGQGAAGASTPSSPSPDSVNPQDSEGPMAMLDLIMRLKTWDVEVQHKNLENELIQAQIDDTKTHARVNEQTVGKLQQDIKESMSRVDNNTILYKVYENQAKYLEKQANRYDEVVNSEIAMNMAKAGLDNKQAKVAIATFKKLTEEAKWIGPEARARIAQYFALVGKTNKEISLMDFNAMKTVTLRQARSMGIDVAKVFGGNGSYAEDTLVLISPTGDKDHPWEIVCIDPDGNEKSKDNEPEPEKVPSTNSRGDVNVDVPPLSRGVL